MLRHALLSGALLADPDSDFACGPDWPTPAQAPRAIVTVVEERAPSRRVVEQRVRNRIIEYLDLAASYEEQAEYDETAPPFVNVPYEVINIWGDWVPTDPRTDGKHLSVFSVDEVRAMCEFQGVLDDVVKAVPNDFPTISDVQESPAWNHLRIAASKAREVFAERGKMPEDDEVFR